MDLAEITLQAINLPFLNLLRWNFFYDFLNEEDLIYLESQFKGPMGKFMSIFELAENLILVLTKLDTEHGLAQPQLVLISLGT